MRFPLLIAGLALIATMTAPLMAMETNKEKTEISEVQKQLPVIKAITFYADSCGACKILEPRVSKAMTIINSENIDPIKFNFSNKKSIEETKILANEKNIQNILQKYGAKTGFVVLVDEKRNIVDELSIKDNVPEISSKLAIAVANAS